MLRSRPFLLALGLTIEPSHVTLLSRDFLLGGRKFLSEVHWRAH